MRQRFSGWMENGNLLESAAYPQDFKPRSQPLIKSICRYQVCGTVSFIKGEKLPAFGCATYRLVLDHVPAREVMALKKGNARFSSKVYVNGEN